MGARLAGVLTGVLLHYCVQSLGHAAEIDQTSLADETDGTNWAAFGRTFSETHYSPLTEINRQTIDRLGLAWSFDLSDYVFTASTPLAVDGTIYFAANFSEVHAIDARSGSLLWHYDPEVPKVAGAKLRGGWGARGLAFWKGKVYVGTQDGRLIALSAANGNPVWSVQTTKTDDQRYITGPPRVFDDTVIIGHGGSDYGPIRGYVTAYDTATGKQRWRFWIVPGNPADGFENEAMAMAAKTWSGEWWKFGGGGATWNAMTYDPVFDRVYLGTGNGAPWNRKIRSPGGGDNLFLCAIVALDAHTGDYVWHYQTTPGESWDYNSSMDMTLATLEIGGKPRQVILHAPKNGFFYVIDRADGRLLSAEKIGRVTWAERIDLDTGRPIENPQARYPDGEALVWPSPHGVHNWHPQSYSPETGLVYVPTTNLPGLYTDRGVDLRHWQPSPGMVSNTGLSTINFPPDPDVGSSALIAWNPVTQRQAWTVPTPALVNGGTLATAGGMVFQGHSDGYFNAFDSRTGEALWRFDAQAGIVAPPITFNAGGGQYVAVMSGQNGGPAAYNAGHNHWQAGTQPSRLLVFKLDAKSTLAPMPRPEPVQVIDNPALAINEPLAARGSVLFGNNCLGCHGPGAVSGGGAPDLRASAIPFDRAAFSEVLREGSRVARGMPRFAEFDDASLDALRHYIRQRARESRQGVKKTRSSSP